jgi:hypothetical protein
MLILFNLDPMACSYLGMSVKCISVGQILVLIMSSFFIALGLAIFSFLLFRLYDTYLIWKEHKEKHFEAVQEP